MSVRPDVRLDDAPMQDVSCGTCGAHVLSRKSSWEQTSIQWSAEAAASCVERRASSPRPGPNGSTFIGCAANLARPASYSLESSTSPRAARSLARTGAGVADAT